MALDNGVLIDIRCETDYTTSHAQNSYNLPWGNIKRECFMLPARYRPIVIIMDDADISGPDNIQEEVAAFFTSLGFNQFEIRAFSSILDLTTSITPGHSWDPNAFLESVIDKIESLVRKGIVLDVGTGSGRDAVFLGLRGWTVYGIENREKLVRQCHRLAERHQVGHRVLCIIGDINNGFGLQRGVVDFINVCRFIHRPSLNPMLATLRIGGLCAYSHFLDGCQHTKVGHPKTSAGFFLKGELETYFPPDKYEVLHHDIQLLHDERPIINMLVRKCKN